MKRPRYRDIITDVSQAHASGLDVDEIENPTVEYDEEEGKMSSDEDL